MRKGRICCSFCDDGFSLKIEKLGKSLLSLKINFYQKSKKVPFKKEENGEVSAASENGFTAAGISLSRINCFVLAWNKLCNLLFRGLNLDMSALLRFRLHRVFPPLCKPAAIICLFFGSLGPEAKRLTTIGLKNKHSFPKLLFTGRKTEKSNFP